MSNTFHPFPRMFQITLNFSQTILISDQRLRKIRIQTFLEMSFPKNNHNSIHFNENASIFPLSYWRKGFIDDSPPQTYLKKC